MKQLTILTGANATYRREYLEKLLRDVPRDELTVYHSTEFDEDEQKTAAIFSQCRESGLFGARNVVVVKKDLKDKAGSDTQFAAPFLKALQKYLAAPNPDTWLIITAEKFSADLSECPIPERDIEQKDFKPLRDKETLDYIERRFADAGIRPDPRVPSFLYSLCSGDLEDIARMIELGVQYAAADKTLSFDSARGLFASTHGSDSYDLMEGIFLRNVKDAAHALADMRIQKKEIPPLLGLLQSNAKSLWNYLAQKSTSMKGRDYFLSQYARKCDLKFVSSVIDLTARTEKRLKTMGDDFAWQELELFVLTLDRPR